MKNRLIVVFMVLVLILSLFGNAVGEQVETTDKNGAETLPVMRLHQISVGSASAYVITVDDLVILVDCGVNSLNYRIDEPLFEYLEATIDHVDAHIVTHYHNDHAMYIKDFSAIYGNENTVVYGPSPKLPERFLPLPNGTYCQMKENDQFNIGPLEFTCIGPESAEVTGGLNCDSLNFLMRYGDKVFMFTGDFVAENMGKRHMDLLKTVDLLVFPHHGLKPFQISQYILPSMQKVSVVLVSANAAGNVRVFCKQCGLKNVQVYGNGQFGNIVVECDGKELNVLTQVKPGQFRMQ